MPFTPPEDCIGVLGKIFHVKSTAKVIELLLSHGEYSIEDVANKAGISLNTASRELNHLMGLSFLTFRYSMGRRVYRWNSDVPALDLLEEFVSQTRKSQVLNV